MANSDREVTKVNVLFLHYVFPSVTLSMQLTCASMLESHGEECSFLISRRNVL